MMCGTYSCVLALPRLGQICVVGDTIHTLVEIELRSDQSSQATEDSGP